MAYTKQVWSSYDTNKTEEENIKNGAVGTAERLNYIESGIEDVDQSTDKHIKDKGNPHNTTATQVGLGNVKNYDIASVTEATAGAVNNKYMTPFLVSETIKSIKENLNTAQLSKITADDGTVFLKVADTETIISTIVAAGAGIRTGTASAKVSDNPTSTNFIMFVANMVTSSGGYVIGTNTAGITWTRAITSKGWSGGWQQLTSTSQAQISKITADDGGVYQGISSGSILSVVLANKRGLRNYHAYGAVTDLPSNSVYRFIANMTSDTHGNVSGMDDLGNYYARAIVNSAWVGEWRKI